MPSTVQTTTAEPLLVSCAEAAWLLGVKPYPVYQLCESGELPSGRIGRQIVIPFRAVREYARTVVEHDRLTTP